MNEWLNCAEETLKLKPGQKAIQAIEKSFTRVSKEWENSNLQSKIDLYLDNCNTKLLSQQKIAESYLNDDDKTTEEKKR